jgi:DNA-binding NarL/FixJ family response regulator
VSVRVLIADDQQLIRAGFRMILSAEPDIEVIEKRVTGSKQSPSRASSDPTSC